MTLVLWGAFGQAARAQPFPSSGRQTPPNLVPPNAGPGQNFSGDAPGAQPNNPAPLGPPPFLIDANTPFERPVQTIEAGPLFGGQTVSTPSLTGRGEHLNSAPAAMGRAIAEYKEMTELPAGIGFIGGAGITPRPARGPRAGGPPARNNANANGRDPAIAPVPPPPAGVLDQPGITLLRSITFGAPGGD
jgi:hypothetical protein